MRLLIISHTPHYLREGRWVGWGATVREIDRLATLFMSVVHVAPLHREPAPNSACPHQADNVRLSPVAASGGGSLLEKLSILLKYPQYALTIWRELKTADVVHVRAPANISLLAITLLCFCQHPRRRWIKYAGSWQPYAGEPLSYRFQRWLLARNLPRAVVTVNGQWPDQPPHVHAFLNPCLTEADLLEGQAAATEKKMRSPLQLIFVGRLESSKGAGVCLEVVHRLNSVGLATHLDLIGDGPERSSFEQKSKDLGLAKQVNFHGWLPRSSLGELLEPAHFILLPSCCSEGWPKVLSEAMAYGAVPIASDVSSIPQVLKQCGAGRAIAGQDPAIYASTIREYARTPETWQTESRCAVACAQRFSFAVYLEAVRRLIPAASAEQLG